MTEAQFHSVVYMICQYDNIFSQHFCEIFSATKMTWHLDLISNPISCVIEVALKEEVHCMPLGFWLP